MGVMSREYSTLNFWELADITMSRLLDNFANSIKALGIFFVLLGIGIFAIALFVPGFLGIVIAILLMVGGATRITFALLARTEAGFWLKVGAGSLYGLAGLVLLTGLFQQYFSVSAMLGMVLLIEGLLDLILASKLQSGTTRRWLLISSGAACISGIMFLVRLEVGTAWLIGLVAGLCCITPGVWFMLLAAEMKKSGGSDAND
jgi:uncharacterized membrane protein HdeD (DUF308 family)